MNPAIDISNTVLHTERLILRPWQMSDLSDFYEYASVDGVGQMAGWLPHENMEKSREILTMFLEGRKTFALEYDGKVIGSLGVEEYNTAHFPELDSLRGRELGYVLSKNYWGMGLMPEAVKAVTEHLFHAYALDFLIVGHFDFNRQSARVAEKCGFRYVKTVAYKTRYGKMETALMDIQYNPER